MPFGHRVESPGRATVADGSAGRMPNLAPKPDEKRRHSCFSDLGWEVSRPMRISTGVDSRPNGGTVNHSTESTGPPQAARTPLGGRERITQGSRAPARAEGPIFWTAEPWKPAARRRAAIDFTERVFGYRAESPGCQTSSGRVFLPLQFGYRAESPGRQTVADGAAGRMPNPVSKPDEKRRHSCFSDPKTGGFPSVFSDLHRRRFPSQRRYARMIPQRQPAGNASGRRREPLSGGPRRACRLGNG